jgi:putative transposase
MDDHAHLVVLLPPTVAMSVAMQVLKANSSKWMNENWPEQREPRTFAWQAGYAAFSVSKSSIHDVVAYVENQEQHLRKFSFQEELLALLKKHEIEYDERYIWK